MEKDHYFLICNVKEVEWREKRIEKLKKVLDKVELKNIKAPKITVILYSRKLISILYILIEFWI